MFENRVLAGVYDPDRPDNFLPENHALLLVCDGQPTGTVRLDCNAAGYSTIRLVAIADADQGRGRGRTMMALVEAYALALGCRLLEVNSAADAVGFYQKVGWTLVDAEREHLLLQRVLASG